MTKKRHPLAGVHKDFKQNPAPRNVWGDVWDEKEDDDDDDDDPTHKCQVCSTVRYVDDYQIHTPSWCEWCGKVRPHERLDYESDG